MKKVLSILLSIIMLTSVICGISFDALGENGYPYAVDPGVYVADQWGFYQCECTSYCAYKLNTVNGVYFHNTNSHGYRWSDAGNWDDFAKSIGITVNNTPAVGSIFYNDPYTGGAGSSGHVAWVSAVNGDYVTLEEYNWDTAKHKYHTRTVLKSKASGYIHIKDIANEEPIGHLMTESEAAGQTIPDGDYYIVSGINQNYFVDIPGENFNTAAGTNVSMKLWSNNSLPNVNGYDCFTFQYQNNGFYSIKQKSTNMCLDVENISTKIGANVQMIAYNGNNAQLWSVEPTASGYRIRAKCSSFPLDVAGGIVANETNIRQWDNNDTTSQRFGLIPRDTNERPIQDGVYTIKTKLNDGYYLDVGGMPGTYECNANVHLWSCDTYDNDERYLVKYVGDGWYRIYEQTSGLAVEVDNPGTPFLNNKSNVKLYLVNDSKGQFWKIRQNNDGSYNLMNKLSGYYLDLENGLLTDGANVSQHTYTGSTAQCWNFTMDPKPAKPVVSVSSKDKAVTVTWTKCQAVNKYDTRAYSVSVYQKTDNGATTQIASKTGITDTKYTFTAPEYGNYFVKVTAVNTNYDGYKTVSDETAFTVKKLVKKANPLVAKGKTATVKFANLKKKNQTVAQKNAFSVTKAQGKVTYTKASGNKKIAVSSAGKITVKKGLKKGTYKVKVKVKAAGNATYKAKTVTVTATVKVK